MFCVDNNGHRLFPNGKYMIFDSIIQTIHHGVCLFLQTIISIDLLKQKRIYIYLWLF